MISTLTDALKRILSWLQQNQLECAELLQPGLTTEEINEKVSGLPFQLPKEVYELYQWHNGTSSDTEFFPGYWFIPLELAVETYYENMSIEGKNKKSYEKDNNLDKLPYVECWNQYWFPLFELDGQVYLLACNDNPQDTATVWNYFPEFVHPELRYENLTAMMLTIAGCYETGAYYLNEEGFLEEDELQAAQIRRKHNPRLAESSLEKLQLELTLASLTEIASDLMQFKDPKTVDPLIQILQSPSESVPPEEQAGLRALAARILGEIGDLRAVDPLIRVLPDPDWMTRYWSVISLGQLKDHRAVPHLTKILLDSQKEVRQMATWALGKIGDT